MRLVTASARSRPAWTSGSTEGGVAKASCVSPASTDCTAGAPPLNGTWTISTPASRRNSTAARCGAEPLPEVAKLSLPGFFFACAISSCTEFTPMPGFTERMSGEELTLLMAIRSFSGWKPALGEMSGFTRIDRRAGDQHGVAVGRALRHVLGGDARARAGPVLHHDRLAERLAERLLERARHEVRRAAGREADHQANRLGGIGLRERQREAQSRIQRTSFS